MLSGKSGPVVTPNEPAELETVTTFGLGERRSRGSAASVTRTMPTAFTSKVRSAEGPSNGPNSCTPALFTRTSSRPSAASTVLNAAATERRR